MLRLIPSFARLSFYVSHIFYNFHSIEFIKNDLNKNIKLNPEKLLSSDTTASDYDLNIATQGYGVANWYFYNGNKTKAKDILQKITSGKSTYSFGFIAAETLLARGY